MMPKGVKVVIVVSTLIALIHFLIALASSIVLFGIVQAVFSILCLFSGPILALRSQFSWKVARLFAYGAAFLAALFFLIGIANGIIINNPLGAIEGIITILYLIGIRGYLNESHVKSYYGITQ